MPQSDTTSAPATTATVEPAADVTTHANQELIRLTEQAEQTRAQAALSALPETRQLMLRILKRDGSAGADRLAAEIGITLSGARQHLTALEQDGLIAHRLERTGPGRPRHWYELSSTGDSLFPRHYGALTTELLSYVQDEDPEMVERIFARRGQRRLEGAQRRMAGLPFPDQVRVLAEILDEDGYLADFRPQDDGSFIVTEHNCAVLSVAMRYRHACNSELEFIARALPNADVERIAHRLNGAHVCAYRIAEITQP
jgi:predicted ArsR family transcriptional regulator